MKKKPLSHSPLVRSDTAVYHGAATASIATVSMPRRAVRMVSQAAGTAAASHVFAGWSEVVVASTRRCVANHQVHGSTTASGPTNPIGPLQTTARPSSPPITAARRHESFVRQAAASGPASKASAKSTVAQVVRQVRIASGVAACASMPTRRQPT